MPGHDYAVGATPLALDRLYVALADAPRPREAPARLHGAAPRRASTPSATTSCGRRCRAPSATSRDEERGRYGQVLEQYYRVRRCRDWPAARSASARTTCCWSCRRSALEPLSPAKRLLERTLGNPRHQRHATSARPTGSCWRTARPVKPGRYPRGVGGRRHADGALFPRPARRPRHGRLRAHRHLHAATSSAERPIAYIPTYER